MKLVVGLGNPGTKYRNTRHNVGFRTIDELARRSGIMTTRRRFSGEVGSGSIGGQRVILLKPMTYMNCSGHSVREAMTYYKLDLEDLLVIVDDLALPVGRLRIRAKGSAGGHNGLADIIDELGGTDGFCRLRIGIGQVQGERMVDHVLSAFSPQEKTVIEPAIGRAADAVEGWLTGGPEVAMNRFNRSVDPDGESDARS